MRNAFINRILKSCEKRDDIFVISGDAGLGVFDAFKEQHPDRFLNLGAAEQNMISFAAGLAITGRKVVVYNIIPFVLYRCYEQVRNDICYQNLPIILAGIGSGLTYSPQGMTHYSVEDIGLAQTMPNLTIISPIDPIEAQLAADFALESDAPVYVRLAKRGEPNLHADDKRDITLPQVLRKGGKVALVCHGSICEEVLKAADLLEKKGVKPLVISTPMLQPLNRKKLAKLLEKISLVVSVEEHFTACGLGGLLTGLCAEHHLRCKLITRGVPYRYIHEIHDNPGMRRAFGISAPDICKRVLSETRKKA